MFSRVCVFKLILAGLLLAGNARAVTKDLGDSPYEGIVKRNAFELKPIPPVVIETNTPPPPPSNLKLTGISTITDTPQLMLIVTEPGGKQVNKMLKEGEKDGAIEVVSIDAKAGSAKVRNAGTETLMTFEKDGVKLQPGPAPNPMAMPFTRPLGSAVPQPGGLPNNPAFTPAANFNPNGIGGGIGGNTAPTGFTDSAAGGLAIPTRSVRTPPVTPQAQPAQGQMSVEEQALMIELNRHLQDTGQAPPTTRSGRVIPLPPLPPTPLSQ